MNSLTLPSFLRRLARPALVTTVALASVSLGIDDAQAHGHAYVGVLDTDSTTTATAGDQLAFRNYSAYDSSAPGERLEMSIFPVAGPIFGYYGAGAVQSDGWTPTTLAGTSGRVFNSTTSAMRAWDSFANDGAGGPLVAGALGGSYIVMELVSVTRTSGSATFFDFWNNNNGLQTAPTSRHTFDSMGVGTLAFGAHSMNLTANNLRIFTGTLPYDHATEMHADYSAAAGIQAPTYTNPFDPMTAAGWTLDTEWRWNVGNGQTAGDAVDPYGHIHNRAWVTDAAGAFEVVYKLRDLNGIHPDSENYTFYFHAIPEPQTLGLIALAAMAGLIAARRRKVAEPSTKDL